MSLAFALATAPLCEECGLACPLRLHATVFDCRSALKAELARALDERDRWQTISALLFDYLDPTAEENTRLRLEVARLRLEAATPLRK